MIYSEVKKDNQSTYTTIEWEGDAINIKNYLPIESKIDLIQLVAQQSVENGIFMPIKVDMYMGMYLIFFYTDIEFTEEEKENIPELFDEMFNSGLYNEILNFIPDTEKNIIYTNLDTYVEKVEKHNSTTAYMINQILEQLPITMEETNELMENFNTDKFAEVMNFARAANGGRDLPAAEKQ